MRKLFFVIILLFILLLPLCSFAEDLFLVKDKVYLLNFNEEIVNFHADENNLDAQIIHTIFDDNKQILISLKNATNSVLQVKTANNYFVYNIKNSNKSSENLLEIDIPPLENLDVDIYEGN